MAIRNRRGDITQLDRSKLLPGEYAISTDGTITICYAPGETKDLASQEDIEKLEGMIEDVEYGGKLKELAELLDGINGEVV